MKCRHCSAPLSLVMADLGTAPPSNAYISKHRQDDYEVWYPLKVLVCESCWLVQTQDFTQADELFTEDYAYFSSYSKSWLAHASEYVEQMTSRFKLDQESLVVEVASNDGYLLQYVSERSIPCLGIEPTRSTAAAARDRGIRVEEVFFGEESAREIVQKYGQADLCAANNVLAHVPVINDFVRGFKALLKAEGVATFEFPHLQKLIEDFLFDTIYHEHFSYLSLTAVSKIFESCGLRVFDVEELSTHGGSYRVFVCHDDASFKVDPRVDVFLQRERDFGISDRSTYLRFQERLTQLKRDFLVAMIELTEDGPIVAYGAAAKGNTLLNFCRIDHSFISYIIDQNPNKQGMLAPGSRIPIVAEPDQLSGKILLLPWNLQSEITQYLNERSTQVELVTYRTLT